MASDFEKEFRDALIRAFPELHPKSPVSLPVVSSRPMTSATTKGAKKPQIYERVTADPSYWYKPLPPGSIRLLCLLPSSSPTDDVRIKIFEVPLADVDNRFVALSYTWAPRHPEHRIRCDGGVLTISANLYEALLVLRSRYPFASFWIDQININQQDVAEKGVQVAMMGAIYSKAKSVYVWLGREIYHKKGLAAHVSQFSEFVERGFSITQEVDQMPRTNDPTEPSTIEVPPREAWDSIFAIFQNNYFRRVWIIQETVLARDTYILISIGLISWVPFLMIGHRLDVLVYKLTGLLEGEVPEFPPTFRRNISAVQSLNTIRGYLRRREPNQKKWTLLSLVSSSSEFEATESRDLVYGLLGLLEYRDHCAKSRITPDYSDHLDLPTLLKNVFLESIVEHGMLNCLSYCVPNLPKDIPSWMAGTHVNWTPPYVITLLTLWDAGGQECNVRRATEDGSVLSFRITRLGSVSAMTRRVPGGASLAQRYDDLELWKSFTMTREELSLFALECHGLAMELSGELWDGFGSYFFESFFCDISFDSDIYSMEYKRAKKRLPALESDSDTGASKKPPESSSPREQVELHDIFPSYFWNKYQSHLISIMSIVNLWRFGCVLPELRKPNSDHVSATDRAQLPPTLMGWFPDETEPTDTICVVHGYRFPVVIRPAPGQARKYRFLGICYVQGIMDGEALVNDHLVTEDALFV